MRVFGTDTTAVGCFVRFDLELNKAGGAVLHMPAADGKTFPMAGSNYLPFVITDIQTSNKENLSIQKCFESRFYTYAFGSDVESVTINMVTFLTGGKLGPTLGSTDRRAASNIQGKSASLAFDTMRKLYDAGRISSSRTFGSLAFNGGTVANLMLVGNTGGVFSLDANIYQFQLNFLVLPRPMVAKKEGA